ncbi:hypothetical protein [Pseudactinotalea sp. HY158]|uniref:hypothetical protein n=1 Tax=Pseudactinotalea sp. HY158 TaxID=2654547 RepID=UPI0018920F64|nr:hypothetical protein [Pseudactinotalea sp. HY158]
MSQFQPPAGPQGEPPFGSAGGFGESAPAPGGYTGQVPPSVPSAAAPGHYQQADHYQQYPQQQYQQPEQYQQGQQYQQSQQYQQGAGYPAYQPAAPSGPSLFEDPVRLGKAAWLAVAVFSGLVALAAVLSAIANFSLGGLYGGASNVLSGIAVLLKGVSLAAVVATVGRLAIDFFVGAALDRADRAADRTD